MDAFFAGLSSFFGDWGWLFILIGIIVIVGVIAWFAFVAVFVGNVFRKVNKEFREDRW